MAVEVRNNSPDPSGIPAQGNTLPGSSSPAEDGRPHAKYRAVQRVRSAISYPFEKEPLCES